MSTGEFWRFSQSFYENAVHQEVLLFLQDEAGIDICFVLLALWSGRLNERNWNDIFGQSKALREELANIRQLRKRNKNRFTDTRYYQTLKQAELLLEEQLYHDLEQHAASLSSASEAIDIKRCIDALSVQYPGVPNVAQFLTDRSMLKQNLS